MRDLRERGRRGVLGAVDAAGEPRRTRPAEPEPAARRRACDRCAIAARSCCAAPPTSDYEEDAHPAYERILDELAPDEARILRLLVRTGPQPAVDVRSGGPADRPRELVAPGLNMIGAEAGCR